jgi:hypothetical protein
MNEEDFVDYVYSFYGTDGVYPFEAYTVPLEKEEARSLLEKLLVDDPEWWMNYDSICREVIRDIMLYNRGERGMEYQHYIESNYSHHLEKETEA